MESIKLIINFLFKLAVILIIITSLIWVVSIFFPTLSLKGLFSSDKTSVSESWLPAPGSFGPLFNFEPAKTPSADENVFSYSNQDNSQVDFITYTSSGMQVVHSSGQAINPDTIFGNVASGAYADKTKYIRNLSIYEGGHIYTGISFYGEAKSTMFQNGRFPIIIADNNGRIVSVSNAQALSSWATPGWTRFSVKINAILPNKVSCTMIFQSASSYTTEQPVRVAIPILCN